MSRLLKAAAFSLALLVAPGLKARPIDHWVGTWATANTSVDAEALTRVGVGPGETTLRQIVRTTLGGPAVRVQLTNQFGTDPLIINEAAVALAGPAGVDTLGGPSLPVTFNGLAFVTIPPGSFAISDPVRLEVDAFTGVAISINLSAQRITHGTAHLPLLATSFLAPGNQVAARTLTGARKFESGYFLKALDVKAPPAASTIVALGDSITGGFGTPSNVPGRYTDVLAQRLHDDPHTANLAVVNEGIGGNRILRDGLGPSAMARLDHDVLSQSGVRYLILIEGTNDIAKALHSKDPADKVTSEDIIAGLTMIADRAHTRGIKVIGATLNPIGGNGPRNPARDEMRDKIDMWVRTNKVYDGFIDEARALQDPANPGAYLPAFDKGDHIHCSPAGYRAMAEAIDLKLFYPGR